MLIAVRVQFYFDHFLPRDQTWPPEGFGIELGAYRARVIPRQATSPLFPEAIDQTLSSAQLLLVPLSQPGGAVALRVADRVLDRLDVLVTRDDLEVEADGTLAGSLVDGFLDVAVRAANVVTAHMRALGGAVFVSGVRRNYSPQHDRFFIMVPHTISWFGGTDETSLPPLPVYGGRVNALASSGAMRSPERGKVGFPEFQESLAKHGETPPLPASLLVSAEERIVELALREAVVALATACEVAADQHLDRTGLAGSPSVKSVVSSRASFAQKRLHEIPFLASSRSFKSEEPTSYDDVERLYRARNRAAHAGRLEYSEGGVSKIVDQVTAHTFLSAARSAVTWLEGL